MTTLKKGLYSSIFIGKCKKSLCKRFENGGNKIIRLIHLLTVTEDFLPEKCSENEVFYGVLSYNPCEFIFNLCENSTPHEKKLISCHIYLKKSVNLI